MTKWGRHWQWQINIVLMKTMAREDMNSNNVVYANINNEDKLKDNERMALLMIIM